MILVVRLRYLIPVRLLVLLRWNKWFSLSVTISTVWKVRKETYFTTQWAAVRTNAFEINAPPQRIDWPFVKFPWIEATHGNWFAAANCPLIILDSMGFVAASTEITAAMSSTINLFIFYSLPFNSNVSKFNSLSIWCNIDRRNGLYIPVLLTFIYLLRVRGW